MYNISFQVSGQSDGWDEWGEWGEDFNGVRFLGALLFAASFYDFEV